MPDAAADDEYDSDGNVVDNSARDAMADLEKSQEQSRREMEMMDELADLRQRNARMELSNANANPDNLLSALHAERETLAQETQRRAEQDEDDALVAQYFAKIPSAATTAAGPEAKVKGKGKGKEKALQPVVEDEEDASGSVAGSENEDGDSEEDTALPASLTVKRRPAPGGSGGPSEPSIASILAERGKALKGPSESPAASNAGAAAAQAKRKREGMQKLLGIKKKKA